MGLSKADNGALNSVILASSYREWHGYRRKLPGWRGSKQVLGESPDRLEPNRQIPCVFHPIHHLVDVACRKSQNSYEVQESESSMFLFKPFRVTLHSAWDLEQLTNQVLTTINGIIDGSDVEMCRQWWCLWVH